MAKGAHEIAYLITIIMTCAIPRAQIGRVSPILPPDHRRAAPIGPARHTRPARHRVPRGRAPRAGCIPLYKILSVRHDIGPPAPARGHANTTRSDAVKHQIFGRKVGSDDEMTVLITGTGTSTGGQAVHPGVLDEFSVESTRRAVQALRERGIEGYVLFENDPTRYAFTPEADFVYPAARH